MRPDEFKTLQAPLKDRYRTDPAAAQTTISVFGTLDPERIAFRLSVTEAAARGATGGPFAFFDATEALRLDAIPRDNRPPPRVTRPTWRAALQHDNSFISPSLAGAIGNQYWEEGRLFNLRMPPTDFRWHVGNRQPPGTSDTAQSSALHPPSGRAASASAPSTNTCHHWFEGVPA